MQSGRKLPPEIQTLIDRERALPPLGADPAALDAHRALLQDVIAAGGEVPEGPGRDALSELMYRLASGILVETGTQIDTPVLAAFDASRQRDVPPDPEPAPDATPAPPSPKHHRKASRKGDARTTPIDDPEAEQNRAFELVRWGAMARQWRQAESEGRPSGGMLLGGDSIAEAEAFAADDSDIAAFVRASRAHGDKRRRRAWATSLVACSILAAVVTVGLMQIRFQRQLALNEELRAQTAEAQASELRNKTLAALQAVSDRNIEPLRDLLLERVGEQGQAAVDLLTIRQIAQLPDADAATVLASASAYQEAAATPGNQMQPVDPIPQGGSPSWDALVAAFEPAWATIEGAGLSPSLEMAAADTEPMVRPEPPAETASPTTLARLADLWDLGQTCSGAMWLGNADQSQVMNVAEVGRIEPGQMVTIAIPGAINMRAGLPTGDYALQPVKGVIPNGARIRVDGAPVPFQRDGKQRYWAPVTVPRQHCSTVFVQYDGDTVPLRVQQTLETITAQGFIAPKAERTPSARGLSEIRYFHQDDAPLAQQVANALVDAGVTGSVAMVPLYDSKFAADEGVMEVWLDLGA
ncbi:hypothetical protein MLD63_07285 [Paracoccus sp. TK19116]|uniref:Uncharacterized protein n=1 Tax=Paracoccus albicereus TaxID=2922394 RepID=A0ABT1MPJ6_9RHOB|nr:hypothetical protein [Paracoccus albicereus]MCQ0970222.1 hypothetical protein [Paracoccus albicereus]